MKRYIKATTEKPEINSVSTEWEELDDGSGIRFVVYDGDTVLFEELFDYEDTDPDTIGSSAADLAILSLSQQYKLSDQAKHDIKGE